MAALSRAREGEARLETRKNAKREEYSNLFKSDNIVGFKIVDDSVKEIGGRIDFLHLR